MTDLKGRLVTLRATQVVVEKTAYLDTDTITEFMEQIVRDYPASGHQISIEFLPEGSPDDGR